MNDSLKKLYKIPVALHLTGIAFALCAGAFVAHHNEAEATTKLQDALETQIALMSELATVTDRNGADETISSIIEDCPRRVEYETLLNELGSLSKKDLITVQNLFESCGSFYAERKALMVSKLVRELGVAQQYNATLSLFKRDTQEIYNLNMWQELVALEQTRSSLLSDQTQIQSKIIALLMSGHTAQSADVRALVHEAQEIGELLNVRDHEIDKIRSKLQV